MSPRSPNVSLRNSPYLLVGALLILGTLFLLIQYFPVLDWLGDFNLWVAEMGITGMVLFVIVYILAVLALAPGLLLAVGAGYAYGVGWGFLLASIGSTIGAGIAFLLGRTLARHRVESIAHNRPDFQKVDRALGKKGARLIFLLRVSPLVPFNLSNYFYGLTSIRFWPYMLASWLGMMPGTIVNVYLGHIGRTGVDAARGESEGRTPLEWGLIAFGLTVTILVSLWISQIARKALKSTPTTGDDAEEPPEEDRTQQ